jgi:hypothetical protein
VRVACPPEGTRPGDGRAEGSSPELLQRGYGVPRCGRGIQWFTLWYNTNKHMRRFVYERSPQSNCTMYPYP